MMRTLSNLLACATLTFTAGLIACVDVSDPFDTALTTLNPTTVGDGDGDAETGTGEGDGDGDPGTGDGDGDPSTGDGDGDPTDTDCTPGSFGCPCDNGMCDEGLSCDNEDMCGLGGDGDGDGDPTDTGEGDPWDPTMCMAPSMPIGIADVEGTFCAAPCVASADCPPGPAGTMPGCVLTTPESPMTPVFCALLCAPGSTDCPTGSTCKEVQPGTGACTYP
jgi:hypothetical protein